MFIFALLLAGCATVTPTAAPKDSRVPTLGAADVVFLAGGAAPKFLFSSSE